MPRTVIMPLFNFQYSDEKAFHFSDHRLRVESFRASADLIDRAIFSDRDREYMNDSHSSLIAEADDLTGYEADTNLLLIAFRVLSDELTPIIKYRLSLDDAYCGRIDDTEMHNCLPGYGYTVYEYEDFSGIDALYSKLRTSECISPRIKNAFYFVYRAFNSYHWIDAFLFHMNVVEALLSKDDPGGATRTIARRASRLIGESLEWNEAAIADLYNTRSRITHGNIVASINPHDNLRLLEKMERLSKLCLLRLVEEDALVHYGTKASRDQYMKSLDSKSP